TTKPTVVPIWCPTIPCIKNHHCATCIQCALKSKLWNCVIVNIEPKQRNSTMPAPMSANSPKKIDKQWLLAPTKAVKVLGVGTFERRNSPSTNTELTATRRNDKHPWSKLMRSIKAATSKALEATRKLAVPTNKYDKEPLGTVINSTKEHSISNAVKSKVDIYNFDDDVEGGSHRAPLVYRRQLLLVANDQIWTTNGLLKNILLAIQENTAKLTKKEDLLSVMFGDNMLKRCNVFTPDYQSGATVLPVNGIIKLKAIRYVAVNGGQNVVACPKIRTQEKYKESRKELKYDQRLFQVNEEVGEDKDDYVDDEYVKNEDDEEDWA
uniref:Uncharacterized protein n=1 Tax=Romanomermis culicivorax TaxID=13658 RepID=A0A915HPS3_ROMCU